MSGGTWGYMHWRLRERGDKAKLMYDALADCEELVDRALTGDDSRTENETKVFDRLVKLFHEIGGET